MWHFYVYNKQTKLNVIVEIFEGEKYYFLLIKLDNVLSSCSRHIKRNKIRSLVVKTGFNLQLSQVSINLLVFIWVWTHKGHQDLRFSYKKKKYSFLKTPWIFKCFENNNGLQIMNTLYHFKGNLYSWKEVFALTQGSEGDIWPNVKGNFLTKILTKLCYNGSGLHMKIYFKRLRKYSNILVL